jgi:multiple sugar transport system substrate-binding protein
MHGVRLMWGALLVAVLVGTLFTEVGVGQERVFKFWHGFTQPVRIEAVRQMATEFERTNPGVKVETEVVPWARQEEKWTSALAARATPDVMATLPDQALAMWLARATRPLDEVVRAMGGRKAFVSDRLLNNLTYDKQLIALPYYAHARVLLYRNDLLQAAGQNPPITWEEYIRVARALTRPPDRYGLVQMWGKGDWGGLIYLYLFMRSNNGFFWDAQGKVVFNSPQNIEAVKQLVELYKVGSPPGELGLQIHGVAFDIFTAGRTAMMFETLFTLPTVRDRRPDLYEAGAIGITYPPFRKQHGWFADAISLVKFRGRNEELADKWIQFLYEDERYIRFLHTIPAGQIPTTRSASRSSRFWDNPVISRNQMAIKIVQEGIAKGTFLGFEHGPNPNAHLLKSGLFEEMLHRIVTQNISVERAVADTHAELERLIERQRRR